MSLEFGCELGVGEVVISITYVGCLNDQMRGFYRFKYTIDGEERYGAATQFEVLFKSMRPKYFSGKSCITSMYTFVLQVAEARRALPCWDEPAHKATYDITLVVPQNRVALSNMVSTTLI